MEAILYICHGSRVREASEQAVSFIHQVMKKVNARFKKLAFLSCPSQLLRKALNAV